MTSDKSVNSTNAGFRSQHVIHHVRTRRSLQHSKSVPEQELPTIAGGGTMRPDSSRSKDADESLDSATPRSSDIHRRQRRIDLGLPRSSRPTSRVTAAGSGAGDSRSSAADSGSLARPTPAGSLARRAAVAAATAVHEATPPNAGGRSRLSSGDAVRRLDSSRDGSDEPTASGDRRAIADSVDSHPSRRSDDNGDQRTTRPTSPDHGCTTRTAAGGGPSVRSRSAMPPRRQLASSQQRRPPTTIRPSTTTTSANNTAGALTMTKSVSQPSFLAMLVSGTAVPGRDAGPATGARNHVTARTPNTRRVDNNVECVANQNHADDDDNNNNKDEQQEEEEEEDDDDDVMKRQMIQDWLQRLETVVLERPPTPVIDDDVPLQTDTAIHIVYDGD